MASLRGEVLIKAIDQAMRQLPIVWPLQQFVATNPFWELIDYPINKIADVSDCGEEVNDTLCLDEYRRLYQKDKISNPDIYRAVDEFIAQTKAEDGDLLQDSAAESLYRQLLYEFMTKEKYFSSLHQSVVNNDSYKKNGGILLSHQIESYTGTNILEDIRSQCLNWLAHYFNPTSLNLKTMLAIRNATKSDIESSYDLFQFWYCMMLHKSKAWKRFLTKYPETVLQFVEALLCELSIPESTVDQYFLEIVWQLRGWLGYIKWQQQYPQNPYRNNLVEPIEVIAIWLAYEAFWLSAQQQKFHKFTVNYKSCQNNKTVDVVQQAWSYYLSNIRMKLTQQAFQHIDAISSRYQLTKSNFYWLWQRAYEINYQQQLHQKLLSRQEHLIHRNKENIIAIETASMQKSVKAQWVFCIDVRSEGLRRHLEQLDNYQTYGFAGFFGFAYCLKEKMKITCQCPALIEPSLLVNMLAADASFCGRGVQTLSHTMQQARKKLLSPFALYEIVGLWFALTLLLKNYMASFCKKIRKYCVGKSASHDSAVEQSKQATLTIENASLATKVTSAKTLLQGIGLTNHFAEFVIICGHTATTENNPYQAALDCGACGGNSGLSNSIIACQVLNEQPVRKQLALQGIHIPDETVFIAACHNTTTDRVHWYDQTAILTARRQARFTAVKEDVVKASHLLQQERLRSMPGSRNLLNRSSHWAELIPEWGLANNAAMVIGARDLTRTLDLERRVFLHSYDCDNDVDGKVLESILLGPMVVAHWINIQYYFSSVDPDRYGSGNKAIHNVLPFVGVMMGNQSDLKYGLPRQSIFFRGKRMHEPRRLCVFVDVQATKLHEIINKHAVLKSLVNGQWILIKALR